MVWDQRVYARISTHASINWAQYYSCAYGSFEDFCEDFQRGIHSTRSVAGNNMIDANRFIYELGLRLPKASREPVKGGKRGRSEGKMEADTDEEVVFDAQKRPRVG